MSTFLASQRRKVSPSASTYTKPRSRLRRGVPKSPGGESFVSSQRSPKEWSYDHDRPPPLPSSPPTRKPSVLKASSSSTRKTGLGYLAFPSSGGGKTGGGGASSTGAGPSSTWLDVPSADRPPPPPRPPRPSMTKKALLKSSGHSSSSSGFSEESRPASTLPTPFTSFPTPKLEAQSRTASPLPVLEIADFGAGDFDWALDTYGSGSAGASSWTGGGVGPGESSSSTGSTGLQPTVSADPSPLPASAFAGSFGISQPSGPADAGVAKPSVTRRGPPAPIQIFAPLVRSPPRIDISSSNSSPIPASQADARPPSSMNLHPLEPDRLYALASAASQSSTTSSSSTGGSISTAGLGSEEAAGVIIGRGTLVSVYGAAATTRPSTVQPSIPEPVKPKLLSPSASAASMRGSIYKDLPKTPGMVYSPASEYSHHSGTAGVGQSLIELTVTQPSTPSSASNRASDSSSSSHKARPSLSQLIVPPPSRRLPPLSQSPTSANSTSATSDLTSASPAAHHPGRPFSAAAGPSLTGQTLSPQQTFSGDSSNSTNRSGRSNPFQFSPAAPQSSSLSLTPQSDPSSSTGTTPHTDGRPQGGLAPPDPCPSPGLPQSYTPGSVHSFLPPSPGFTPMLDSPRTGALSAMSGKFSHPPRPTTTAFAAASSAGPIRSRSESTPTVETSSASREPYSATARPATRLTKSRWASDSDLRTLGSSSRIVEERRLSGLAETVSSDELAPPWMPAAYEPEGRAASPAPSSKASFLTVSSPPASVFVRAPRPTPASSFRSTYVPSSESSGSTTSLPLDPSRPPPMHHSYSNPTLPSIYSLGALPVAQPDALPPSINNPLPDGPPLLFDPAPVAVRSISLADARTQFSTSDVQSIISLAIGSVAPAGAVRMLSAEAMSVMVPLEMRKLQARKEALLTAFRGEARRRKKILRYLNEQRGGTSEGKAGRVASALTTIGSKNDEVADELYTVCNQIEQLRSLLSDSNAGGLSLALGKLNASLVRANERLELERTERGIAENELAHLRAQLDRERALTLEAEANKSTLAAELASTREALVQARTSTAVPAVHQPQSPPSPNDAEPGHHQDVMADESDWESEAGDHEDSDFTHDSRRWSVSTVGGAEFFPFPPQNIPIITGALAAPCPAFPTSPSGYPVSPAPPSPTTPRQADERSPPPPPALAPGETSSYFVFPRTPTLPVPLLPALQAEPSEQEEEEQLEVLQTPATTTSFDTVVPSFQTLHPDFISRSASFRTAKRSSTSSQKSHSHHQGSSSISITIDSHPDLPPSSPSTFALVASYPYASTYSDDAPHSSSSLRPKRSQRKRHGHHFRTQSEANAFDRFEIDYEAAAPGAGAVDDADGQWVDIRAPAPSPPTQGGSGSLASDGDDEDQSGSGSGSSDSGGNGSNESASSPWSSALKRSPSTATAPRVLGDLSLSLKRKKVAKTQSVRGLVSFFEGGPDKGEQRRSAGETTESLMLALATASVWTAGSKEGAREGESSCPSTA